MRSRSRREIGVKPQLEGGRRYRSSISSRNREVNVLIITRAIISPFIISKILSRHPRRTKSKCEPPTTEGPPGTSIAPWLRN